MDEKLLLDNLRIAVAIFRKLADRKDDEILAALVFNGIDLQMARRFIEFLPLAYGRILLGNSGAKFSDVFQWQLEGGGRSEPKPLTDEPVWNAAIAFAQAEVKAGVAGKEMLAVALRGAEIHAANQLLNKGSKLNNLVFTSPLLPVAKDQ